MWKGRILLPPLFLCGEWAKFLGLGGNPWWWRVTSVFGLVTVQERWFVHFRHALRF